MFKGLIYVDDFIEAYIKLRQREFDFILSKFNFKAHKRTLSSFSLDFIHSNWWIIPKVQARINEKITGDPNKTYESYLTERYLSDASGKLLISLGCGTGRHELEIARLNPDLQIYGYDLAIDLVQEANGLARSMGRTNIAFFQQDVLKMNFNQASVDYFLFNSSLHHFRHIDALIRTKIKPALKHHGLVFINEYVGPDRLRTDSEARKVAHMALHEIPVTQRTILNTKIIKEKVYRNGTLRMILADPSECVESSQIIPVLSHHFSTIKQASLGGNILMPVLKHIAHHFVKEDATTDDILLRLFAIEDQYLKINASNYLFAVYQKG